MSKYGKQESWKRPKFRQSLLASDYGIVDGVSQALSPVITKPDVMTGKNTSPEHWGVVFDLDKLNVYSAAIGQSKTHVDTPRGYTQFVFLVVCLRNPHEGGHLRAASIGASSDTSILAITKLELQSSGQHSRETACTESSH